MKEKLSEGVKVVADAVSGLADSYLVTLKHLFRKPITEQYPEYKRPRPARSRARIVLTRSPDGEERCVACYLCSAVCPTDCISIEAAEREDGRRYPPVVPGQLRPVHLLRTMRRGVPDPGHSAHARFRILQEPRPGFPL